MATNQSLLSTGASSSTNTTAPPAVYSLQSILDFEQTLETHYSIRILVHYPVKISRAKFEYYFNLLARHKTIEIGGTTLHITFVQRSPSKGLEDAQFYRRVVGLIGVVDCLAKDMNFAQMNTNFKQQREKLPTVMESLLIGFLDDEKLLTEVQNKDQSMSVIFTSSDEALRVGIEAALKELASRLQSTLMGFVAAKQKELRAERPPCLKMFFEEQFEESKFMFGTSRKRNFFRLEKQVGDLWLLMGSPLNALVHYTSAIRQFRDVNDYLWLAAALEGSAACYHHPANLEPNRHNEIMDRLREAMAIYGRFKESVFLQYESLFKLARYMLESKRRLQVNAEIAAILADMELELDEACSTSLFSSVGLLYHSMGFHRKAAFFLRRCALNLIHSRNAAAYHYLLLMAPTYGLSALGETLQSLRASDILRHHEGLPMIGNSLSAFISPSVPSKKDFGWHAELWQTKRVVGWTSLQVLTLFNIISVCRLMAEPERTARCLEFFTHRIDPIAPYAQILIRELRSIRDLSSVQHSLPDGFLFTTIFLPTGLKGIPNLVSCEPCALTAGLAPTLRTTGNKTLSDFLYDPSEARRRRQEASVYFVQSEMGYIDVALDNTLGVELVVDGLTLVASGVPCVALPCSAIVVPPNQSVSVRVACVPQQAGILSVLGCDLTVFALRCRHTLSKPRTITVVPPLPIVEAIFFPPQSPATPAVYLEGERVDGALCVVNQGPTPATTLELDLVSLATTQKCTIVLPLDDQTPLHAPSLLFSEDVNLLCRWDTVGPILPLKHHGRFVIPFSFWPTFSSCGFSVTCRFGHLSDSNETIYQRSTVGHYRWAVALGLQLSTFDVHPLPAEHRLGLFVPSATFFSALPDPNSNFSHREGHGKVPAEISRQDGNGDVVSGNEYCLVRFECRNEGGEACLVHVAIDGRLVRQSLVERSCRVHIQVPMRRLSMHADDSLPQFLSVCERLVQERISVRWQTVTTHKEGRVLLPVPFLDAQLIRRLEPPFYSICTSVKNGDTWEAVHHVTTHKYKTVTIKTRADASTPVRTSKHNITLLPYQDMENGRLVVDMGGRVGVSGSLEILASSLPIEHTCSFVFFCTGVFKIKMACASSEDRTLVGTQTLTIVVS